jgi:putative acetyltransferase
MTLFKNSRKNMISIRPIAAKDNERMAKILRDSLTEFGANKPGTAYFDAATDDMYSLFQKEKSAYWVAEKNGEIIGGAGIYATDGLPENTCELARVYLDHKARGHGYGQQMIEHCFAHAKDMGYEKIYLETLPELKIAVPLYERLGFEYLDAPLGKTGHFGCDIWMMKTFI